MVCSLFTATGNLAKTRVHPLFPMIPNAAELWRVFWYEPAISRGYRNGLVLDNYCDLTSDD